jgi:hypothetical protein
MLRKLFMVFSYPRKRFWTRQMQDPANRGTLGRMALRVKTNLRGMERAAPLRAAGRWAPAVWRVCRAPTASPRL